MPNIFRHHSTWFGELGPKSDLYKNSYPRDFVEKYIKELLDRVLKPIIVASTVLKKDLMIILLYLGRLSLQICTGIKKNFKKKKKTLWPFFMDGVQLPQG